MGIFDWFRKRGEEPRDAAPQRAARSRASGSPREDTGPSLEKRLDAGSFTPISSSGASDLIKDAGGSWRSAYLDPLNVIPHADLPRIKLIDRGMVGVGLITPEELAEIHATGEQMDELRGDWRQVRAAGEVAVARGREEREERKRRKKAQARERAEQRRAEVAQRRATDIIHLGRGVSNGLADRRANVERLQQSHLPVLATPAQLAEALTVDVKTLRWLAYHSEAVRTTHYVCFQVPKKSGGMRELSRPHARLAAVQQWILTNVLEKVPVHAAAQGFVRGRSTVTNARAHVGQHLLVQTDLEDFFPTVTFVRVRGVFQGLGYSPAVATILALLSTECPRRTIRYAGQTYHVATAPRALPQGACTSPAISNLVVRRLDARFDGLTRKMGWSYTRYADDLTFSTKDLAEAGKVGYLLARIRHIVQDEGFNLNHAKTRVARRHTRQAVTGIVVNDQLAAPRPLVRRLRAILHRARFEGLQAQNRDGHPHFEDWVRGMIAYVTMVNPDHGRKLAAALSELS